MLSADPQVTSPHRDRVTFVPPPISVPLTQRPTMSSIETPSEFATRYFRTPIPPDHSHFSSLLAAMVTSRDTLIEKRTREATAKEVLREVLGCTLSKEDSIEFVARRRGISPAELEPQPDKIEVINPTNVPGDHWYIKRGRNEFWNGNIWAPLGEVAGRSKHDAEAIAAHLRATDNKPGPSIPPPFTTPGIPYTVSEIQRAQVPGSTPGWGVVCRDKWLHVSPFGTLRWESAPELLSNIPVYAEGLAMYARHTKFLPR